MPKQTGEDAAFDRLERELREERAERRMQLQREAELDERIAQAMLRSRLGGDRFAPNS
jgi:hypothetical protein